MTDATISVSNAVPDAATDTSFGLVEFVGGTDPAAAGFAETLPSDWAFAAQEAGIESDAIDTLREDAGGGRLVAVAAVTTLIVAEADLLDQGDDVLVSMAPAADAAGESVPETGMIMWSAQDLAQDMASMGSVEPAAYLQPEALLMPHDFSGHGFSLDWTDTILA